ncbi:SDR family NAD(P)-dependent oxidoreductase [Catenuloplanes sp. NPDC051500]|uniref:SDR family NAD(P)-dependent oxidoreductase n=1 Tax=Catenuloplanes sp. NPDC051500 TaxID=3363959 RepID=UPI00379DADA6
MAEAGRQPTAVITGASSGIGSAAAELLAAQGFHVVLVGRDPQRLEAAVARVREAAHGPGSAPQSFQADFERLADVHALASRVLAMYPTIDVLVNNAGMRVPAYRRTVDGNEATIQVNHLSHFLLSHLLRESLRGGRIVNTSVLPGPGVRLDPDDLNGSEQRYRSIPAYQSSKAANVLFAMEAASRWPDILSVSFHPGLVRTNINEGTNLQSFFRYAPFLRSPRQAAERLVRLATVPADELSTGGFYVAERPTRLRHRIFNPQVASRLWTTSEKAVSVDRTS